MFRSTFAQETKDAATAKVQGVKDGVSQGVASRTESLQQGKWGTLIASLLALFDQARSSTIFFAAIVSRAFRVLFERFSGAFRVCFSWFRAH